MLGANNEENPPLSQWNKNAMGGYKQTWNSIWPNQINQSKAGNPW